LFQEYLDFLAAELRLLEAYELLPLLLEQLEQEFLVRLA
jgi:hypothetical protein